jgi:arylsulfatase A-like enzyme
MRFTEETKTQSKKMKEQLDRRGFLKLAGLYSLALSQAKPLCLPEFANPNLTVKNILIIVFDAFSAYNISLYGYGRQTTPNIDRLANRAIVYHNHYAAANFTTPGTASLLTGVLSWNHRAFNHNDTVNPEFTNQNIFHSFPNHYRMAYSHNPLANTLLNQFSGDMEKYTRREKLFLTSNPLINTLFSNDSDTSQLSWTRIMERKDEGYAYSLFFPPLYEKYINQKIEKLKVDFPRGLPYIYKDDYFRLEDAIDWLQRELQNAPQPFLGYFHFLPPHVPYNTRRDYYDRFELDDLKIIEKPEHIFSEHTSYKNVVRSRLRYDKYIAYVDEEFKRLFDFLDASGLLESTWLVLTSDHGEMFERGITGHITPAMCQPVIRIPLLIFQPGNQTRQEVFTPTSAIDLLPTFLYLNGQEIPTWCEGLVLPPFGAKEPNQERDLFGLQAKHNKRASRLQRASVILVKDRFKLIYYYGYEELRETGELIELFDIQYDPEEMENLYPYKKGVGEELLNTVKAKLAEVNAPYE